MVLIDRRVRSTGRFGDEQVLVVETLDVFDVIGSFEHRLKRVGMAARTKDERYEPVLYLFDFDRDGTVDVCSELSKDTVPVLCEVHCRNEHPAVSDNVARGEKRSCWVSRRQPATKQYDINGQQLLGEPLLTGGYFPDVR